MNKIISKNIRKNHLNILMNKLKKDNSRIMSNCTANSLNNLTKKNFSFFTRNSSAKSKSIILITKRNLLKKNKIADGIKEYKENKKRNQQYFDEDKEYLNRVIEVEETITSENKMNEDSENKKKNDNKENNNLNNKAQKQEEFIKKVIEETSNKKLSDYISEEISESAQDKYKEINYNYFKQKEIYTRSQIYGVKSQIEKASKADPEWGLNVHRKFLQRNFLKKNNLFYDFEKESFDDQKINYDFLKSLKLDEPILMYECFLPSLKPMISAKRHAVAYAFMLPYAYYMFFFNYDFLFSTKSPQNYAHLITNLIFIGLFYNYKLMRYYNKTLVTQIKYNSKNDTVLLYTHRGFNNGALEVEHKVTDLYGFKKTSWINRDYIFIKSKVEDKVLYLVPVKGIYHEKVAFENIFGVNVNENKNYEDKNKMQKDNVINDQEFQGTEKN